LSWSDRQWAQGAARGWVGVADGHGLDDHGGVTTLCSPEDAVPALPVSLLEPVWQQFAALVPERPVVAPTHPLGCHRSSVPDQVVFEHVVAALVHGSGYERIASPGCSDRTIRRRVHAWAAAGLAETLHGLVLAQNDRMIGIELGDLAANGCITKAPSAGKQGLKRSTVAGAKDVSLHLVSTGTNRHDAPP